MTEATSPYLNRPCRTLRGVWLDKNVSAETRVAAMRLALLQAAERMGLQCGRIV